MTLLDAVSNFHQPENGYRFSADSIALSKFIEAGPWARLADLGAGCGIVGLSALENGRAPGAREFFFVEIEPEIFPALKANLNLYAPLTPSRLIPLNRDWRTLGPDDFGGPLDYIMVNPPYYPKDSGRPSLKAAVNAAKREIHGTLADLFKALARLLADEGRAALSLKSARKNEAETLLAGAGLFIRRLKNSEGLLLMEVQKAPTAAP